VWSSVRALADCAVFSITVNNFPLVLRIDYPYRVVYVRFIGTHAQYDRVDAQTI
jgi:mRNA interferase HigB